MEIYLSLFTIISTPYFSKSKTYIIEKAIYFRTTKHHTIIMFNHLFRYIDIC